MDFIASYLDLVESLIASAFLVHQIIALLMLALPVVAIAALLTIIATMIPRGR